MGKIRNVLIKSLGGYTKKEYTRIERKYQGLLDSKTSTDSVYITNEYIMRCLKTLDDYARKELYGLPSDSWAAKMFNVIHNNWLRVMVQYIHQKSNVIYEVDTTLDNKKIFSPAHENKNDDDLFILNNDNWEF